MLKSANQAYLIAFLSGAAAAYFLPKKPWAYLVAGGISAGVTFWLVQSQDSAIGGLFSSTSTSGGSDS